MTPAEFEDLADRTRLKPAGREMARRVFVDGEIPFRVAKALGVADNTVRDKCRIIEREKLKEAEAPVDWVVITLKVPRDRVDAVRRAAGGQNNRRFK